MHGRDVRSTVTWDEVQAAAAGAALSFGPVDVLARVAAHGDLFQALAQRLPG